MKPWLDVIQPHRDIRAGRFDESVFAAELGDVVAGRGPLDYRDAQLFFRQTYPTQGLKTLLAAVLARLGGQGSGEAVIQIQTPFGGGKTHSLIALYHVFHSRPRGGAADWLTPVLQQAGVSKIPAARVLTFVGTAADALKGKTPWGELADQVGDYALLREHDRKRRAPGKDLLHRLIGDAPTLILMDELAEYAVKARDFGDQVVAFFQELTETVKVLPRCALVVTLPSSAPYGEEGERALQNLQRVFGRVEAIYTPVEGEEIYEVIRRRLFDPLGDEAQAGRTAEGMWELYSQLGDDLPREVRQPAYRERMSRAYPFHPELIDTLLERWSTFPTFQRTRGVLRLLAEVVSDLYRKNDQSPLILPVHINLNNPAIRREFLKHIGNEYEGVIVSDIAQAAQIDRDMGSEYARFGLASGLATAIFFGSFSGSERRGVGIQRLRLAALREQVPSAVISDALRRLEDVLWYLHEDKGLYLFSSQPNLNRVILEREAGVSEADILDEIRRQLERLAGREARLRLWPQTPPDIPDSREIQLAILDPERTRQSSATTAFVDELFKKAGLSFRSYPNALVVLVADSGELTTLRAQIKRYLALRAVSADARLVQQLSADNRAALRDKLKERESDLPFRLLAAYRHLARPGQAEVEWLDMGLPTIGERATLARRALDFLKSQDLLLSRIAPHVLLRQTLPAGQDERPLRDVVEAYWRYPHLPMVESELVARQAVAQGVREGAFGVRVGERVYLHELLPDSVWDAGDAVLVRQTVAAPARADAASPPAQESTETILAETGGGRRIAEAPAAAIADRHPLSGVQLRIRVPWDKLSDIVRGVISPLRSDQADLEIELLIHARAPARGINSATWEHKVKETLRQINAEIIEEKFDQPGE